MTQATPDLDAKALIDSFLNEYGLGSLGDWAWNQFLNGIPVSQIMIDLRSRPEYQARFPAMDALAKRGRAMSEAEYVAYERQAAGLFRAAGLPAGFYDKPEDFSGLIANEVSINELTQRVQTAYVSVATAPDAVKQAFAQFYGPDSTGALAAYLLDPGRALPVIEQQVSAAQFAGIGSRFSFDISKGTAETYGKEGFSAQQLQAGFAQADALHNLERETTAEAARGSDITQEQLLGSSFGVQSDQPLRRRLEERVAAFSGAGGTATSTAGAIGLGGSQKE